MKRILGILVLTAAVAMPTMAGSFTAADPATPNVTATVAANCTIENFVLGFGNYDPLATTDTTGSTTIKVYCTTGTTADVLLGLGVNTDRQMNNAGGDLLDYELFSDTLGAVWPSTGTGVTTGASTSPTVPMELTIYGSITKNQAVPAGDYDDTVTATVNW